MAEAHSAFDQSLSLVTVRQLNGKFNKLWKTPEMKKASRVWSMLPLSTQSWCVKRAFYNQRVANLNTNVRENCSRARKARENCTQSLELFQLVQAQQSFNQTVSSGGNRITTQFTQLSRLPSSFVSRKHLPKQHFTAHKNDETLPPCRLARLCCEGEIFARQQSEMSWSRITDNQAREWASGNRKKGDGL